MIPVDPPARLASDLRDVWTEFRDQVHHRIGALGYESLCIQVGRMRDANARIAQEGAIVADARGNPVPHPAIAVERSAQTEVRTWLERYPAPTRRA